MGISDCRRWFKASAQASSPSVPLAYPYGPGGTIKYGANVGPDSVHSMNNQSSEASLPTLEVDEELLNAIVQEMALLPRLYRRILRESGENSLYTPKFWVLGMLACEGPMSMSTLARRMQVTKQYITALVDRMVDEGLATRRPDQGDRRIINLCITEAGDRTLQDVKARARQEIRTTLCHLEEGDRRRLHRALQEQKEILFMLEEPR